MSLDTSTAPQEQATDEEAPENGAAPAAEKANEPAAEEAKPKRGRPKAGAARKTRTVELTLTVTGSADGDWQAELKHGSTWVARGLVISASAVSRAAKELHGDLSTPIDEVINEAREQQRAKVAALEAELQEAKQALADLDA
ncbi:DUF6319 family protein [Amycolatopsis pithecellobii]|jgi:hypothetical protein|uniref:Mucin n=1 Tax=Amycolatopsis pithecellobii TaxID=664692 RepID=A0A6N7Z5M6_9PSEU|nr:DUF6319 family protein [Amycolatopsis pithecellobii]MTD55944.1 hypothetical protein [Amycolatopsis pithecellobii]